MGQRDLIVKIESRVELNFEPENIFLESESINQADRNVLYTLRLNRIPDKKIGKLKYRLKS